MDDPTKAGLFPFLIEYGQGIVLSFAGVDRDWEISIASHAQLSSECVALDVSGRVVVVIVESDLAPRDHLRMLREIEEFRGQFIIQQTRFVRMDADSRVDEVVLVG